MMEGDELKSGMGLDKLRELIELLKANSVAQFDLERDGLKIRLEFEGADKPHAPAPIDMGQMAQMMRLMGSPQAAPGVSPALLATAQEASPAPAAASVPTASTPVAVETRHIVKSPIVGTFYEAASPGTPPFVKLGDVVQVGQVLCIVEAMKLMNEIESDAAGEIVERIATTGQPVEYGQSLFAIKAL
jgi:acetyl-CoA carboxylase biotin carboxyl carrier protein